MHIRKEEVKFPLFTENVTVDIENPSEATEELPKAQGGFQVPRRRDQCTKSVVSPSTGSEQAEIEIKTLHTTVSKPWNT